VWAVGERGGLTAVREASFHSGDFRSLEALVAHFLDGEARPIRAAAFGVAGPVIGGSARITNLPWQVSAARLARTIRCPTVRLLNDLESTAYGALFVQRSELLELNPGAPGPGNRAVIAAGTGLGQALLCWDGARFIPSATEGGHADFGPGDDRDVGLLQFLRGEYGRVSWERVVSGPGLHNIFRYLDDGLGRPVTPAIRARMEREDPSAVIGEAALDGTCAICAEAVDMFVRLYGAQTGNLALTAMALGGMYVGGGIVTKLLPRILAGDFVAAFLDKAPHRAVMERIPVWVLLNEKTSLIGAAHAAAELV
jgi:glucokinase